jgi:hypothetical protein
MATCEITLKVAVGSLDPLPPGWRLRSNWRGKLILQRRRFYEAHVGFSTSGAADQHWSDATVEDISTLIQFTQE